MLKVRETGEGEIAPTGPWRQCPPGVLPTRVLSRPICHWWHPVALPSTARPITISVANFESSQAGGKSPNRKCKLHQNCTRIAPKLHQNCSKNPSNCTQLQQNHIGVGGVGHSNANLNHNP